MKQLFIELLEKSNNIVITDAYVKIYTLDGCMDFARRASRVVVHANPSRQLLNYLTAFEMSGIDYHLIDSRVNIFSNTKAISHTSACVANYAETFALEELSRKTWELIIQHRIPTQVYENIDLYIPADVLSMYDIQVSQQLLPVTKMSTYKPTDLQRKEWNIADKSFAFSKERESNKLMYQTTLYDKILAYLQLQYYIAHDIAPLYTIEEIELQPVTPYSAIVDLNAYERACY